MASAGHMESSAPKARENISFNQSNMEIACVIHQV